jgi:hypothetical protein
MKGARHVGAYTHQVGEPAEVCHGICGRHQSHQPEESRLIPVVIAVQQSNSWNMP